jgi:catechol 2,3-dioxygenase-like lactoylglutathione lyase family enzyme
VDRDQSGGDDKISAPDARTARHGGRPIPTNPILTDMTSTIPAAFRFDHINLHAMADAPLLRLFSDVMGFKSGWRPPFSFPGRWLYDENSLAALHLVDTPTSLGGAIRLGHFAFRTDEIADSVLARLDDAGLSYELAVVPKAGDVQIFVLLPGGLVVELDTTADPARPPESYRSHLARSAIAKGTSGRRES